jgi:6-phosphogluconolactonase
VIGVLGEQPAFDCVMLGLGEDGHTASLFPGKPSLTDPNLICLADHGALPPPVRRLTFTYPLINNARNVVVIATGAKKLPWIDALLAGNNDISTFPLSGVNPHGKLWIVLDRAAWPEA